MTPKRPSILDGLYLSDGVTLAKDAAIANGVSDATLRFRLKKGLAPDEAVKPVEKKPNAFQRGEYERPYLPKAEWQFQQLSRLASLSDGRPAWPVAQANGIAEKTFRVRLSRGWSSDRAATEPVLKVRAGHTNEWEYLAVKNGISLRSYRARIKAGMSPDFAACKPLR